MIKKFILSASIIFAANTQAQTVVYDTVSTGSGYANQIWYSFQTDEMGSQAKDNWDLAFEISGFNSSIRANTTKNAGLAVYESPYDWSQWRQFDTAGYKQWKSLYDSDTLWDIGALNRPGTYNTADLGWGSYDPSSHVVSGTRLFLLNVAGKAIKLSVRNLVNGVYTVTYAGVDNSDSTTFTVTKSNYTNKNFAYYAFDTKTILDREPDNSAWDITFTKYITDLPAGPGQYMPYAVTGILQNKGVKIAEVRNVNVANTNDYQNRNFSSLINEIGYDWKVFNMNTFTYEVTDSLLYFVQDRDRNIWKVVLTGFSGSSQGNYMFSKQKLGNLGLVSFNHDNRVQLYPNPLSSGGTLTLVTDLNSADNMSLSISDINGQIIFADTNPVINNLGVISLPDVFSKGVYFITLHTAEGAITKKLLVY